MKKSNKMSLFFLFSLIFLSSIGSIPAIFVYGSMESHVAHNYSEEYWSILYDTVGNYLEEDYNPGSLSSSLNEGDTDNIPEIDNKFFIAYSNLGNVQSLYVAMQNFSWGLNAFNTSLYGVSPFQVLVQHFRPPGRPNIHAFVINRFLGLLAYRDNKTDGLTNLPDASDELYLGWSFFSEFHKYLLNNAFRALGVPEWMHVDNSSVTTAIPIPMVRTEDDDKITYSYGMSYKDLFILWQKLSVNDGLNETDDIQLLAKISAFAIIEELNFTYTTTFMKNITEGRSIVTTTTEYDIGKMTDLWVVGDDASNATNFGGTYHSFGAVDLSYYNETDGIGDRLNGTISTPGLSLAIINSANIAILDFDKINLIYTDAQSFVDRNGLPIGGATQDIKRGIFNISNTPVYKIDFDGKPNYTLNGAEVYPAPTRVINAARVKTDLKLISRFHLGGLLAGFVGNITRKLGVLLLILAQVDLVDFYYVTSFPVWSGGTINQDPTFTAYGSSSIGDVSDKGAIPGYELWIISILSLMGISMILIKLKKQNKLKFS